MLKECSDRCLEYDTMSHPVAALLFVSSDEINPIELITKAKVPLLSFMDPGLLKCYVLVPEGNEDHLKILEKMNKSLGTNCFIFDKQDPRKFVMEFCMRCLLPFMKKEIDFINEQVEFSDKNYFRLQVHAKVLLEGYLRLAKSTLQGQRQLQRLH
ncbi:hypothetical protein ROZALSC1DRAFT_23735 [Rozella allomycis CSF55]|uniref:Uncharacterized protein n=1 Tax=Rozella allomycis (strain CSF55) TaxID=988480 RepID=A0A4P9YFY0_ROZAC|nr:hypothetical protein ROZALSC1DRAFT_23735 [Rozella allomycis CSF55]